MAARKASAKSALKRAAKAKTSGGKTRKKVQVKAKKAAAPITLLSRKHAFEKAVAARSLQ